jgi:hypothetical protein
LQLPSSSASLPPWSTDISPLKVTAAAAAVGMFGVVNVIVVAAVFFY